MNIKANVQILNQLCKQQRCSPPLQSYPPMVLEEEVNLLNNYKQYLNNKDQVQEQITLMNMFLSATNSLPSSKNIQLLKDRLTNLQYARTNSLEQSIHLSTIQKIKQLLSQPLNIQSATQIYKCLKYNEDIKNDEYIQQKYQSFIQQYFRALQMKFCIDNNLKEDNIQQCKQIIQQQIDNDNFEFIDQYKYLLESEQFKDLRQPLLNKIEDNFKQLESKIQNVDLNQLNQIVENIQYYNQFCLYYDIYYNISSEQITEENNLSQKLLNIIQNMINHQFLKVVKQESIQKCQLITFENNQFKLQKQQQLEIIKKVSDFIVNYKEFIAPNNQILMIIQNNNIYQNILSQLLSVDQHWSISIIETINTSDFDKQWINYDQITQQFKQTTDQIVLNSQSTLLIQEQQLQYIKQQSQCLYDSIQQFLQKVDNIMKAKDKIILLLKQNLQSMINNKVFNENNNIKNIIQECQDIIQKYELQNYSKFIEYLQVYLLKYFTSNCLQHLQKYGIYKTYNYEEIKQSQNINQDIINELHEQYDCLFNIQLLDQSNQQIQINYQQYQENLSYLLKEYVQYLDLTKFIENIENQFTVNIPDIQKITYDEYTNYIDQLYKQMPQPEYFLCKQDLTLYDSSKNIYLYSNQKVQLKIDMTEIIDRANQFQYKNMLELDNQIAQQTSIISQKLIQICTTYLQDLSSKIKQSTTTEQISNLGSTFQTIKETIQQYEQQANSLPVYIKILQQHSYKYNNYIQDAKRCNEVYTNLQNIVGNVQNTIKVKQQELLDSFKQNMASAGGMLNGIQLQIKQINDQQQEIINIFKDNMKYKIDNFNKAIMTQQCQNSLQQQFEMIQKRLQPIQQKLDQLNGQVKEVLAVDKKSVPQNVYDQLQSLLKQCNQISQFIKQYNDCKQQFDLLKRFSQSEFIILKNAQYQEDDFNIDQTNDQDNKIFQQLFQFIKNIISKCLILFKIFKNNYLQQDHWEFIEQKLQLKTLYMQIYQTSLLDSQIPLNIQGNVFYYATSLMLQNEDEFNKTYNNIKNISSKAEQEFQVRQAVQEVQQWITSQTCVQFKKYKIGLLTQQQIRSQSQDDSILICQNFKQVLQQITEKKSIISSVKTNQYYKIVEKQIQECEMQIESIIRITQSLRNIANQVQVIEPVINRKVLPQKQKIFYESLNLYESVILYSLEDNDNINLSVMLTQEIQPQYQLEIKIDNNGLIKDDQSVKQYLNVIYQIEQVEINFNQVQQALRIYLEQKRLIFPRFYFVSDSDVLEIMANGSQNLDIIQQHIKKLFTAVERLQYVTDKNEKGEQFYTITEVISLEGEHLKLCQQISVTQNMQPEIWLKQLEVSIKQTTKIQINEILNQTVKDIIDVKTIGEKDSTTVNQSIKEITTDKEIDKHWLKYQDIQQFIQSDIEFNKFTTEAYSVALQVAFCAYLDYALDDSNKQQRQQILQQILNHESQIKEKLVKLLMDNKISQANFQTEEYVLQVRAKSLLTDINHRLILINNIINARESQYNNPHWLELRDFKARMYLPSNDIFFCSLNNILPYIYEYQGCYSKLIHTKLSEKCYSTVTEAIYLQKSALLQGKAGSGKTETLKKFMQHLGRFVIVFNCDSAIDRNDLQRIMMGIVLCGASGCFDEVNRLSVEVLGGISMDIEYIQNKIKERLTSQNIQSSTFTLGEITVPLQAVTPYSSIFVTMNPASREYRGRNELPFSLIQMLSMCFMNTPDIADILDVQLGSAGFKNSKILAKKIDLVYKLAANRIQKEVHLDWGLRSMQATIRQSQQLKQLHFQDNDLQSESKMVIKSLADSTYSRIQGQSLVEFKSIIDDVFGKLELEKGGRFGCVGKSEECLVDALDKNVDQRTGKYVLQLYRVLTQKLGVSLLGKTATGKTIIRQQLKQAIEKSTNGMIQIKEFIIEPKSMARSQLLGQVDTQTKEWIDGALSLACREAVKLVERKEPPYIWPWIVLDGEQDPVNCEALNSALDDNRLLSLSSGERIRFPIMLDPMSTYCARQNDKDKIATPVSFIFETDSLKHMSPASVSRMAVILLNDLTEEEQIKMIGQNEDKIKQLAQIAFNQDFASLTTQLINSKFDSQVIQNQLNLTTSQKQQAIQLLGQSKYNTPEQQVLYQLQNKQNIIISGKSSSGKFYIVNKQTQKLEHTIFKTVYCNNILQREMLTSLILNECSEQNIDDNKYLVPKQDNQLIICLRNVDIVQNDIYNHSWLYCLLYSIIVHKQLYLTNGQRYIIKNISFVLTCEDENIIPPRLKRQMIIIHTSQLKLSQIKSVNQQVSQFIQLINDHKEIQQQLQKQLDNSEQVQAKIKLTQQQGVKINKIIKFMQNINTQIIKLISKTKYNEQMQLQMIQTLTLSMLPFESINTIIEQQCQKYYDNCIMPDIKIIQSNIKQLTVQQDNSIILKQSELQLQSMQAAIKQIDQICQLLNKYYIAGQNIKQLLSNKQILNQFFLRLQSYLISFNILSGVFLIEQPSIVNQLALLIAQISLGYVFQPLCCEKLTQQFIKQQLIDFSENKQLKKIYYIDNEVLLFDKEYIQFLCVICEQDINYLKQKVLYQDIKTLANTYFGDNQDLTEQQKINQFLEQYLQNVKVVLSFTPYDQLVDNILFDAPALKRHLPIICSQLIYQQKDIKQNNQQQIINCLQDCQLTEEQINQILDKQQLILKYTRNPIQQLQNFYKFEKISKLYQMFTKEYTNSMNQKHKDMKQGLSLLKQIEQQVQTLSKTAQSQQKVISESQLQLNEQLKVITEKMQDSAKNKVKAENIQSELSSKQVVIQKQKDEAEAKLANVQPIIDQAKQAVSSIPQSAITEIKSFNNPPKPVQIVLEAVLKLMKVKDLSWMSMRSFLAKNGAMKQIANLDITKIDKGTVETVKQFVSQNDEFFEQERIVRVSRAAAPLAMFVKASLQFLDIYMGIEPMIKKCQEATQQLEDSKKQLDEINNTVAQLTKETEQLQEVYNKSNEKLQQLKQDLQVVEHKANVGKQLIDNLASEKEQWQKEIVTIEKQLQSLDQNNLYLACMLVLCGQYNNDIRDQVVNKEQRDQIDQLLYDKIFENQKEQMQLRISNQSLENAASLEKIISTNIYQCYALSFASESTGVLQYLKGQFKQAQIVSAQSENLANLLAVQARFGQTVIITDCDSGSVPQSVLPYINQLQDNYLTTNLEQKDKNDCYTQIVPYCNTKSSDTNKNFRIIMISNIKLNVPLECERSVLQLSFEATQSSRLTMFNDIIMQKLCPQTLQNLQKLQKMKSQLIAQQNIFQQSMLKVLISSSKSQDILNDKQLFDALEKGKVQKKEMNQTQKTIEQESQKVEQIQQITAPLAQLATDSLTSMEQIQILSPLYQIDDQVITSVLLQILKQIKQVPDQITKDFVQKLQKIFKEQIIQLCKSSTFENDSTAAQTILMSKITNTINQQQLDIICQSQSEQKEKVPEFIEEQDKQAYNQLKQIDRQFTIEQQLYKQIKQEQLDKQQISQLTQMQQIACILFNKDRMQQILNNIISNNLPINNPVNPLNYAITISQGLSQPILVYTQQGYDPTQQLQCRCIQMLPDKYDQLNREIENVLDIFGNQQQQGKNILVLRGGHLCCNYLEQLPGKLKKWQQAYDKKYNNNFTQNTVVILLLEPRLTIPIVLSRISIRICLSQSQSFRQSVATLIKSAKLNIQIDNNKTKLYYGIIYIISVIQIIFDYRKIYIPIGFCQNPQWTTSNFNGIVQVLQGMFAQNLQIKQIVQQLQGYFIDVLYGVSTTDINDDNILKLFVQKALNAQIFQLLIKIIQSQSQVDDLSLKSNQQAYGVQDQFLSYLLPPCKALQGDIQDIIPQFTQYINKVLPDIPQSQLLQLQQSSMKNKQQQNSLVTLSGLQRIVNEYTSSQNEQFYNRTKKWFDIAYNLYNKVKSFNYTQQKDLLKTELAKQMQYIQQILKKIVDDKQDIDQAVENNLLASQKAQTIAKFINANILPENYIKSIYISPYSSYAPLEDYSLLVLQKGSPEEFLQQIESGITGIQEMLSQFTPILKLHVLPNPMQMVETIRRYFGQLSGKQLDLIQIEAGLNNKQNAIQIDGSSFVWRGINVQGNVNINVDIGNDVPVYLYMQEQQQSLQIPAYIDQQKNILMPVFNYVSVDKSNQQLQDQIILYNCYCHLKYR